MIFSSFTIAIFIASLENKRISSLVGNHENTVNSVGSRPYDKGGGGGGGGHHPPKKGGGGGHPDPEIMGGRSPKNILVRK